MTPQSAKKAKYKSLEYTNHWSPFLTEGAPRAAFCMEKCTAGLLVSGGQSPPPLRMDRRCGRRKIKNTAATKKFRARQCFMLTKQARLWYNETLYWENGAKAPFQSAVMIPAFPRNYKWNSAKTNNSPPRVKSVESRSLRKSTEKMRKERREY